MTISLFSCHCCSTMADRNSVDVPLLNDAGPTSPNRPTFHRQKSHTARSRLRKWWRPLAILALPPLLLLTYSMVHQMLDLPPLPKVRIDTGGVSSSSSGASWHPGDAEVDQAIADEVPENKITASSCVCGATQHGQRLCDIYHKTGLRSSTLHRGSGARIRRLLARARDGEDVKIGILGGSGESVLLSI